jgi:2-haloacid dehalogenase
VSARIRPRWVTFDCFGTLVDWQAGFTDLLTPFAGDRATDIARAYATYERLAEGETPHRPYKHVLGAALVRAAAACGVSLSDADARAMTAAWGRLRLFDDVEPMLAELRRNGWRLAVLTNCDDDLFEITHRTFRTPFDLFVTAERVRGYKPAPWHFRAFERLTGASKSGWVHVASSLYDDIVPAQAMGIAGVWLDREQEGQPPPAAVRVRTAADVVEAIDGVFANRC